MNSNDIINDYTKYITYTSSKKLPLRDEENKRLICNKFINGLENTSKQIAINFAKFRGGDKSAETKIVQLEAIYKSKQSEYIAYLKEQLVHLREYEGLFDLIVNSDHKINIEDLKNVLKVFKLVKDEEISEVEGIRKGINYMTNTYNLPTNLFNKDDNSIKQFIDSL